MAESSSRIQPCLGSGKVKEAGSALGFISSKEISALPSSRSAARRKAMVRKLGSSQAAWSMGPPWVSSQLMALTPGQISWAASPKRAARRLG
ncbi:hypothetical protein D3C73_1104740 [compost metagenome]